MSALRKVVRIPSGAVELEATFDSPALARGAVLFAHGSGANRIGARNRFVAGALRISGFATLLVDLITPADNDLRRFEIAVLGRRLNSALQWMRQHPAVAGLPMGLFGAGTGAAAALTVAAMPRARVSAIVCRGGRPDLAGEQVLARIDAPTLLIVGGNDPAAMALSETAWEQLRCPRSLQIIAGATRLFDEPNAVESVAACAGSWFGRHLGESMRPQPRRPASTPRAAVIPP